MKRSKQGICAALLCLAAGNAAAQNNAVLQDPGQKTVRVVRTATPPVIDGDLSDAVWAAAAVVDDLHQVTPVEYAEPDERTEVLILYDDDALYVAARLYDNEPEQITARNMRQNDNVGQDDRFYVTIDPFNDRRSGYFFGLNPNGVRADGLYRNVTEFYGDWDSIFDARRRPFRRRLDRRDRDSVQVDLVRSDDGHVGAQLLAHRRAQERDHRLGLAQSRVQPRGLGARGRLRGARSRASGSRSCRRSPSATARTS